MKLVERRFKHARGDLFYFYLLGDFHVGNIFVAEDEIIKFVKKIKDNPFAYWIGMGDLGEYITPSDPRWDQGVIAPWLKPDNIAEGQRVYINDLLGPIKDKCLGLLWGNHENKIRRKSHVNVHQNLCNDFKVQNLGFSCFIHFHFTRGGAKRVFRGAFTHGSGGAILDSSKLRKLHNFMDAHDANIYGYAHTHACKIDTRIELRTHLTKKKIISMNKVGALTGCFFKTYLMTDEASYGEQQNYRPTPIGCARIEVDPTEGTYKAEALI